MRARHLSVVVATVCGAVLVALVVVPRYAALPRQPCLLVRPQCASTCSAANSLSTGTLPEGACAGSQYV